jgi:dolichol-phosphate mannosyltransferase
VSLAAACRQVSLVVPVLNEAGTIEELVAGIRAAMAALKLNSYEIILIDDGSTDSSWQIMKALARSDPQVTGYRLRRNFGKATALALGAEVAKGSVLITLDGDLQDDPAEIPRLLAKLDDGFDLVSGWKKDRQDPLHKTLPSKVFNLIVRSVTGIRLNDFNCGLKAARREVYREMPLYGELHRFIPVLAHDAGYKVVEIPVVHHPRVMGKSKYGLERFARGFLDLLTVLTITRFGQRPGHLFGGLGLICGVIGSVILLYLFMHWLFLPEPIRNRPLLLFGVMLVILSAQLVTFGILAEMFLFRSRPRSVERFVAEVEALKPTTDPVQPDGRIGVDQIVGHGP